tara:strand:+ start:222 stop:2285 length:2064 start_codon:yes stop_codon:yes gene_type:complete
MAASLLGEKPQKEQEVQEVPMDPDQIELDLEMEETMRMGPLVARVREQLSQADTSRFTAENQWIKNLLAYRGIDSNQAGKNDTKTEFRSSEEHKPYIRTTTVKTRAAFAQIMESLLQNSRFPLMIEATPVSSGAPNQATNDPQGAESQEDFGIGFEGDGQEMQPGATQDNMSWKESDPLYGNMSEGHDKSGGQFAQLSPAGRAAEQMNKLIQDQLEESNANTELRKSVFESCLLGSGLMKGVFTEKKTIHKWVEGKYSPTQVKQPKIRSTSLWDLYVDPNAVIFEDAEFVIERHRKTAKQMRDLLGMEGFRADKVQKCIDSGANYVNMRFEHIVREEEAIMNEGKLWEVLEYWGYISKEEAVQAGLPLDGDAPQVQVNLWICGQEILRVTTNPFLPQRIPYFMFNYEQDAYNLYGTGVPECMQDSQKMMNGFARLAVDNLALAGNMVFDIDETMLVAGQDYDIYPGKVFRRQGGQAGAAVTALKFPSTANENLQMMDTFRRQADEATGIPSVSHGQTGVSGTGRTSSGLNMILENASLNIKTVIRNMDDDLLQPLGKMLFYWNNQYNTDKIPAGDFDCVATGIRSYTKNEIKVQRLQTLLQLSQNPALAPMIKLPYLIRELVKGMDLDPEEVINDMNEAKIYAEIIGMAGGVSSQSKQANAQQNPEGPAGTSNATANTAGAGNVEGI